MAYDSARGRTVLSGGRQAGGVSLADTWEWDGTAWIETTPASSPLAHDGNALAYDSARGRAVLFGGYEHRAGGELELATHTWEYDGATWSDRTTTPTPPRRFLHAMAYDSARGRTVLFGGRSAGALG